MKVLAFGDVHIGSGQSLGRAPGDRLRDHEAVLERIFALGEEREVDAFLMAGDLYDGPTITPAQLEVFVRPFERLEGRIPLIAISGNSRHDLALQDTNALAPLRHVPGVHVYSRPALHDLGPVQVACMPWVSPARLVASMDGDVDRDRVNQRAAELMVKVASGIADPNVKPTILMLHGSISGASLPAGISTDELREPVIDLCDLIDLGFAAIVASHIHVPQCATLSGWKQASSDDDWAFVAGTFPGTINGEPAAPQHPTIYTGSPMPLNFGETNVPHGVWILDVDASAARAEFVPVESRPLVPVTFDFVGIPDVVYEDVLYDQVVWKPEVEGAIVKVSLRCTQAQQRRLDLTRLRAAIIDAGAHSVKIDVDSVREQRSRVDHVTADLDPVAAFDLWLSATGVEAEAAAIARAQMLNDLETVGA